MTRTTRAECKSVIQRGISLCDVAGQKRDEADGNRVQVPPVTLRECALGCEGRRDWLNISRVVGPECSPARPHWSMVNVIFALRRIWRLGLITARIFSIRPQAGARWLGSGLQSRSDQPFNRRSVIPGQFKFRAIIQYHGVFAFVPWPKFLDPFGIHQCRAVNSHESG